MYAKHQICQIGRRIHEKGFAAANDGNISIRLSDDEVLCTPTMQSKGFMKPEDLCVVDMDGEQIAGNKKRSSEIMLHLEVYRQRTDVKAVVHCHPPHATSIAIAREPIPQCVLPEVEIFLGEVPIAPYATPGSADFSRSIIPFVKDSNVIVLANHGTLSFGTDLELAFWFTDILDAYCRTLILSRQLGGIHHIGVDHANELLAYKQQWGFSDLRIYGDKAGCNVCGHQSFREHWGAANVAHRAFNAHPEADDAGPAKTVHTEIDLDRLADLVAQKLASRLEK